MLMAGSERSDGVRRMPRLKLTKSVIDALPIPAKDIVYWDTALPGFGLKVTPKGRKVFIVLYRTAGAGSRLRKYTIGPYGRVTLHQGRTAAQRVFAARLDGRDPAAEKRLAHRRILTDSVEALVETFIRDHVSKKRSGREISRILRREVIASLGSRSVHELTKRDIVDLVTAVSDRGAPKAANKLLKVLKTFLRWCVGRAIIEISPAEGVPAPSRDVARDRVLTDDELARVILTAREIGVAFGGIIELLALAGQRRQEVARLTGDELDLANRVWTIPASRTKNGKPHFVHLSNQVLSVLMRMPRLGRFIFSNSGTKPFQAFSAAKRQLDALSGVSGWRLHDLRRTCVSGMARLGIPPHVADKILNHQAGTISGVAAVYQRHEFLAERKHALDLWGDHVDSIVAAASAHPSVIRRNAA
jgi:integrase